MRTWSLCSRTSSLPAVVTIAPPLSGTWRARSRSGWAGSAGCKYAAGLESAVVGEGLCESIRFMEVGDGGIGQPGERAMSAEYDEAARAELRAVLAADES